MSVSASKLKAFIEKPIFEKFIIAAIILNSIGMGLETSTKLSPPALEALHFLDRVFLGVFALELVLKLFAFRLQYFKDAWRNFDLFVILVSLVPAAGAFSVLRALRILKTLRMISVVPSLRKVVSGLLKSIPGLGAVAGIMTIVFYISAVMATQLFQSEFPQWFGDLGRSSYSLFQIMTLESWSMGIVRPVMETYPYAWMFFIPFILATTFVMLNLFIAVIVNSMQAETDASAEERAEQGHWERLDILSELTEIKLLLKNFDKEKTHEHSRAAQKDIFN